MQKQRVLITGANGYIGRHVVSAMLKHKNIEVIAADLRCDRIEKDCIKIETSIFDDDEFFEKTGRIDRCIHLAWRNGFVHNSGTHMQDLSKHVTFIEKLCQVGGKSISVMGTMHEIGYWEGAIDENTPANPVTMYGIAKNALRAASKIITDSAGVSLKWLRAYYIVGDDEMGNSIFSKIIAKVNAGEKSFPFTMGKNLYDFIDIDELAEQIACASIQDEIEGEINCCTGKAVSLADRVEAFIREKGFDIKLVYGAFPDRKYDSPGVWGDSTKIEKIMKKAKNV